MYQVGGGGGEHESEKARVSRRRRCAVEQVDGVGRWQAVRQLAFQQRYGTRGATGPFVAKIGRTEQAEKTHGTANQIRAQNIALARRGSTLVDPR